MEKRSKGAVVAEAEATGGLQQQQRRRLTERRDEKVRERVE